MERSNSSVTPRLRFPEFVSAGGWAVTSLGEVISLEYGAALPEQKRVAGEIPVIGSNGIVGYHNQALVGGPAIIVGRKGSVGRLTWVDSSCFPIDTTFFVVSRRPKRDSMPFLYRLLQVAALERRGDAGAVPGLSRTDVTDVQTAIPEVEEQEKVADCLTSLDDVIAAQAQKVEALRTHKRALMQRLFPREGETVPRLRFPEFRDGPAWDRRTLSQLLSERKRRNRDLRYGPADVLSVSGDYGCVNQIELLGRSYAGASVKDYHVVETGDLVYTKSPLKRNPYGIIKANKGRVGIVSTLYAVYHTTEQGNAIYLDHYFSRDYHLNRYLQPIVKKGAKNDMKVNNAAVLSGEITVPGREEQARIAEFLTSFDHVIAAEARKETALVAHRVGLLQQLFPSPEAD
jgi:restriction endonuclease S subunit